MSSFRVHCVGEGSAKRVLKPYGGLLLAALALGLGGAHVYNRAAVEFVSSTGIVERPAEYKFWSAKGDGKFEMLVRVSDGPHATKVASATFRLPSSGKEFAAGDRVSIDVGSRPLSGKLVARNVSRPQGP